MSVRVGKECKSWKDVGDNLNVRGGEEEAF
jgi:hypothetical protein